MIPSEIGRLPKLKFLYLGHNALKGTIASELGNLLELDDLRMEHNALEGLIPIILELGADMPDIGQRGDKADRIETQLGLNKACLTGLSKRLSNLQNL